MDSIDSTDSLTVCKKVSHVLQITAVVAKMINCWVLGVPNFTTNCACPKKTKSRLICKKIHHHLWWPSWLFVLQIRRKIYPKTVSKFQRDLHVQETGPMSKTPGSRKCMVWGYLLTSFFSSVNIQKKKDVENTPSVAHFPRETTSFPHLFSMFARVGWARRHRDMADSSLQSTSASQQKIAEAMEIFEVEMVGLDYEMLMNSHASP